MTTYTLTFELAGDSNNSGGVSIFEAALNGTVLGTFMTPSDSGHELGVPQYGTATFDVTGIFDPTVDNALMLRYIGGSDYGNGRRMKIAGSDGTVYYGEYPVGYPFTPQQYNDGIFEFGDGDFPPLMWDNQLGQLIQNPIGPDGNPYYDRCWFYFTIPVEDNTLSIQFRPDTDSEEADTATINLKWIKSGTITDLGNYTSFPASVDGNSPWKTVNIALGDLYDPSVGQRLEITHVGGEDDAHIRNVWVTNLVDGDVILDYGQYPLGKPYTADVQDGMVGGVALFNDGGTLPDAAFYAKAEFENGTQYSMAALEQVIQFPLTWYFGTAFAPPLRQFPRDDRGQGFLRGVRVDNEPSSRQMSLRQGWENTYL